MHGKFGNDRAEYTVIHGAAACVTGFFGEDTFTHSDQHGLSAHGCITTAINHVYSTTADVFQTPVLLVLVVLLCNPANGYLRRARHLLVSFRNQPGISWSQIGAYMMAEAQRPIIEFQNPISLVDSKSTSKEHADNPASSVIVDSSCGLFGWRPACLQRFATPNTFFGLVCACLMLEVAAHTGYVGGVLSTIEKDFQLKSSEVAFVTVVNHIGAFTSIVTSYIGSKTHRPRFIALGVGIIGIGQFTCGLPHFFSHSSYQPLSSSLQLNSSSLVCGASLNESTEINCNLDVESTGSNLSKAWLLILGELITGIGSGPVIPLMITYIDDCVGKAKVSVYVGILFACAGSGPVIGWLLSGLTLSYHVDFDRNSINQSITPSDPGWVGAWWLGFLVFGPLMMLLAPFLCLFPREMPNQENHETHHVQDPVKNPENRDNNLNNVDSLQTNADYESNQSRPISQAILAYFRALKRLATNIPFISVTLSTTWIIVTGLGQFYFGAKYLETQYGLTTWLAPIVLGGMVLPATLGGILLGSYLVKRWNLTEPPQRCARMSGIMGIACMLLWFVLLFLGCGHDSHFAGLKMPYPMDVVSEFKLHDKSDIILFNECNSRCQCSEVDFNPVCGNDGITFASPCFAGCDIAINDTVFSDCSCIPSMLANGDVVTERFATLGKCVHVCLTIIPYCLIYAIGAFFVALSQNPNYMVTLRSVEQHDRAIGLGLSNVVMRILGNLLGPIYFGVAIDTSCLLHETNKCGHTGACVLYDLKKYRTIFIGMLFGFVALHTFCVWIAYYSLRAQQSKNQRQHQPLSEGSSAKTFTGNQEQDSKVDKMYPL
ncbi:solute carrier organic anion transporter family member 2B1-like [Amphiura filiformis]|uniref:solute carrier organic anion transporter family member 2B1-like n=1 Tax=Amphiura filiformis TaxID=82378 RepID=UPI003B224DD1